MKQAEAQSEITGKDVKYMEEFSKIHKEVTANVFCDKIMNRKLLNYKKLLIMLNLEIQSIFL